MKPKPRNIRVLLLNVGRPDRWTILDPNHGTIKRLLPLLDSAFPPEDDLIFYGSEDKPGEPQHYLVRGNPAYGEIMIIKRKSTALVNMERDGIPRSFDYITKKQLSNGDHE